jgi:chemotaxis response regulator CheB
METAAVWKNILSQEVDMEVVGETTDLVDTLLMVGTAQAEVVVIDLPETGEDPGITSHLLEEYPKVKVVAVSHNGSRAVIYQKGIIRRLVGSLQSLKDLLRAPSIEEDMVWDDDQTL